jgi:hypothetical protein
VSCTSASACTAVGSYSTVTDDFGTLAERWNGTTWAIQATPNPSDSIFPGLYAVSCTSASACTAVDGDSDAGVELAEYWNGTTWAIQATPNPGGSNSSVLNGVSCTPTFTWCIAVGSYVNSAGSEVTLAERYGLWVA